MLSIKRGTTTEKRINKGEHKGTTEHISKATTKQQINQKSVIL